MDAFPKPRVPEPLEVDCPICNAKPGQRCGLYLPPKRKVHLARELRAQKSAEATS